MARFVILTQGCNATLSPHPQLRGGLAVWAWSGEGPAKKIWEGNSGQVLEAEKVIQETGCERLGMSALANRWGLTQPWDLFQEKALIASEAGFRLLREVRCTESGWGLNPMDKVTDYHFCGTKWYFEAVRKDGVEVTVEFRNQAAEPYWRPGDRISVSDGTVILVPKK